MSKISLRAYFREIEGLIEHGRLDEAMAHCKHILQFYPKLIAAYRLLGKTFLEEQRYSDATDIFQRVLSSIPDDFVSHVGMSIIREDEGNLDAGIWHMERAFEVQPYNAAIQDELRRLFLRRDNVEPHKIRLTRGALARMYAKGDLHQQAIAELRAALAEDAQRPDLQVLLARMYFLSGTTVEAVDMCSVLLKKLPFCLEANRLLAAILPHTERKEEAKAYQQRVQALDPYIASAPISTISAESVPENIATIEKLDYQAAAPGAGTASQPAWAASLGVSLEGYTSAGESLPDWMTQEETGASTPGGSAPGETTPEIESAPGEHLFTPEDENGPGPSEEATEQAAPPASGLPWEASSEISGIPDWITGPRKGPSETPAVTGSAIPDWMKEAGWEPGNGEEHEPPAQIPPIEETTEGGITPADIPDWLREMAPGDLAQEKQEEEVESLSWLEDVSERPAAASTEEVPDWLAGKIEEEPVTGKAAGQVEESPDWLSEKPEEEPAAAPSSSAEGETAVWPPVGEEKAGEEDKALGDTKPIRIGGTAPEPGLEEIATGEGPAPETHLGPTAPQAAEPELSDQDAALAWLESLAAKQGASEEELITRPEERASEMPSWLAEAAATEEVAPMTGTVSEEESSEQAAGEWQLEEAAESGLSEEAQVPTEPEAPVEAGFPLESETLAEAFAPEETRPELEPASAIPAWLQEAAPEVAGEEPAGQEPEKTPEMDIPDWLKDLGEAEVEGEAAAEEPAAAEELTAPEELAVAPASELPDWLQSLASIPAEEMTEGSPPVEGDVEAAEPEAVVPAMEIGEPEGELPGAETAVTEPAGVEPPVPAHAQTEPGFDLTDQDAALAWLESLAAKQGVSEEQLITTPEERDRELPTWIIEAEVPSGEAAVASQAPSGEEPVTESEVSPEAGLEPALQAPEAGEEMVAPLEAAHPLEAVHPSDAARPFEYVELPPAEETPLEAEKPSVVEAAAPEKTAPEPLAAPELLAAPEPLAEAEAEPELPAWIAELAAGQAEEEEITWTPPEYPIEASQADTAPLQEIPEAFHPSEGLAPVSLPLEQPALEEAPQQVDINTASLIELENLPGVGFVKAQNILSYRDAHGPFMYIDDLLNVPGIEPSILAGIRDRLTAGEEERTPVLADFQEIELQSVDPDQSAIIQARNALIQKNVPETIARYSALIKKEHMLDTVIRDLYEALYHFPMDVSIWQTLGDAYMRNNQHQEALDAYIKAEELLR